MVSKAGLNPRTSFHEDEMREDFGGFELGAGPGVARTQKVDMRKRVCLA